MKAHVVLSAVTDETKHGNSEMGGEQSTYGVQALSKKKGGSLSNEGHRCALRLRLCSN